MRDELRSVQRLPRLLERHTEKARRDNPLYRVQTSQETVRLPERILQSYPSGRAKLLLRVRGFPCIRLQRIDRRYRTGYSVSLIENLRQISREGLPAFLRAERERYLCARCGGTVCIHNGKCYDCEPIESWRKR